MIGTEKDWLNWPLVNVSVPLTSINTGSTLHSAHADVSGAHAGVEQAQQPIIGAIERAADQASDMR